jgi:hypothetical protein
VVMAGRASGSALRRQHPPSAPVPTGGLSRLFC